MRSRGFTLIELLLVLLLVALLASLVRTSVRYTDRGWLSCYEQDQPAGPARDRNQEPTND